VVGIAFGQIIALSDKIHTNSRVVGFVNLCDIIATASEKRHGSSRQTDRTH
jgi:hypothetical protein